MQLGRVAKLVKQFPPLFSVKAVKEAMHNQSPSRFVILRHEASASSYLHRIKMQQHEREYMCSRRSVGTASAGVKSCKLIETI